MSRGSKHIRLLACLLCVTRLVAQQEHKLLPSDGTSGDIFGTSVAIHAGMAVIGAPGDGASGAGSAYVFLETAGLWSEMQKLTAFDAAAGDAFGTSVALGDSIAIVGAPAADDTATDAGAVYVFALNGSSWVQTQKMMPADHMSGDGFGKSVALKDSILCIGAYQNDGGAANSGAVYVYQRFSGTWQLMQKLSAPDADVDDYFGYSVAVDDSSIVVGAYLDDDNGINSGSVYVFSRTSNTWTFAQKLTASNGASGDAFGFSVGVKAGVVCTGAYASDMGALDGGAVYLYTNSSGSWVEDTVFYHSDVSQDDWFGFSVALSANDVLACGAFHRDDAGGNCGAVYLYSHSSIGWLEEVKILASDAAQGNHFGLSAAIDGFALIAGADGNDDNAANSGAAYVFPLCTWDPGRQICSVTVDSSSAFNIISWNKPTTAWIDSFLITRNTGSGFQYLTAVDYSLSPRYDDLNINPQAGAAAYRINTYNMCQTLSDSSAVHQTIRLNAVEQVSGSVVLSWNSYTGFTFPFYRIWRDSTAQGSWELIAAKMNTQHSHTDPAPPSLSSLRYLVEAQRSSPCAASPNPSSVISNTRQVISYGIEDNPDVHAIHIYPNPVHRQLRFTLPAEGTFTLSVTDMMGALIFETGIDKRSGSVDVSGLANGTYLLTIWNSDRIFRRMVVKD